MKKTPLIIGGIAGCLFITCGGVALIISGFAFIGSRSREAARTPTAAAPGAPARAAAKTREYVNSREGRTGTLAENFVGFSFSYPEGWQLDQSPGANNFVRVVRVARDGTSLQENFAVGWLSAPTEIDRDVLRPMAGTLDRQFSAAVKDYRKVTAGDTTIGPYDAIEFRFTGKLDTVDVWGRVVLVVPPRGTLSVVLVMVATRHAPELSGPAHVGVKGGLPVVLGSFRFADAPPPAEADPAATP